MKIGKDLADVAPATLRFFRQIGVEEVSMPSRLITEPRKSRPIIPPPQTGPAGPLPEPWDVSELERVRDLVLSAGLVPTVMNLPISGAIVLGKPERDRDIEHICQCIRVAGQVGIRTLAYGFTALRASEGYFMKDGLGRGGADYRAFDAETIRGLPPLSNVGEHSRDAMWERLTYFLRAIVPVAESAGVRLAIHPNDPPVAEYRGVAQPVRSVADLERVTEVVDSPANRIYIDTGVLTEMGEDAPAVIRHFGRRGRIGKVHFRNVRVEVPYERYTEVFLDEGDCDMLAAMRALQEVGYDGIIEPDHTPHIPGDTFDTWIGWAFAVGQIVALRRAATNG